MERGRGGDGLHKHTMVFFWDDDVFSPTVMKIVERCCTNRNYW